MREGIIESEISSILREDSADSDSDSKFAISECMLRIDPSRIKQASRQRIKGLKLFFTLLNYYA